MALPLRARPRLPRGAHAGRWVVAARGPPAMVAIHPERRCSGRVAARHLRRTNRYPRADGAPVRGHGHARGRRMDGRRDRARPVRLAAAPGPGHRRTGPVGAVVGSPAPACPGPRGAQARSVARHRQGRRAGRITGHVRRGGRVGMAGPVPAGPRPDHRRRDREDSRDRIRPRHLPGRGARLPDARRPGQPVRAARAGHGPARRRHPVAWPIRDLDHASRSTWGRSRMPRRAASCSCADTPWPAAPPVRAKAAGSTCSWAT